MDAGKNGLLGIPALLEFLTHPADQKHFVVHRQAEQNTNYNDRQEIEHRCLRIEMEEILEMAVLNDIGDKS
ncbi:hypothetical protein D3C75_946610 [compost metagenome]